MSTPEIATVRSPDAETLESIPNAPPGFDAKQLRACFGQWPTGVAIITTRDASGVPKGLTVNSFSSVSLDPPLVLWSLARNAKSYEAFAAGGEFAINLLAQRQGALARHFASSGGDKFTNLPYDLSGRGVPLLKGASARIICAPHAMHDGGDHLIILGRVIEISAGSEPSLLCAAGQFHVIGARHASAPKEQMDAALIMVGDELLTGSTADSNGRYIVRRLRELGVDLREVRVIADDVESIAMAVRSAHAERSWVFVVGGLGPTHDDLTAAGIARAFGVPLEPHPEALRAMGEHHAPGCIPEGRAAAARLPAECKVFPDKVSGSAGFLLHNVIALPGDPVVAVSLFEISAAHLRGIALSEISLKAALVESDIASGLRVLQAENPAVQIGCYPYFGAHEASVNLVLRSRHEASLIRCESQVRELLDRALARRRDPSEG